MKSVVMISYWFPPDAGASVYRPLRFLHYLPAMGWFPTVIAADLDRYTCSRYDPGLLKLVPAESDVVRVKNRDLWQAFQAMRGRRLQERLSNGSSESAVKIHDLHPTPFRCLARELVRKVESWFYHPDIAMFWIRPAVDATVRMSLQKGVSVIWTTAPPYSSFIVAEQASKRTGLPYVLDFRTSWTIVEDDFTARRPIWAKKWDRKILYNLLRKAQAVVFAYDAEAECFWRAYQSALDVSKIHIIPNGYEGEVEDFDVPQGDRLTLLYTGTLSDYRYDTLLQALHEFKRSQPARARQVHLIFVGDSSGEMAGKVQELGLSDVVEVREPTSYAEVIQLQRRAHVLLMLERVPTMKGYELLAGAKLFMYLKAGRPIFGVLPDGQARKVLQRVQVSTVADVECCVEIIAVLQKLLDAWLEGSLSTLLPNRGDCLVYSAEHQTKAMVRALEGKPAVVPFVPGIDEIPPSLAQDIAEGHWPR